MLCFPSVKNRKRNQNNLRQLYKTPNFVAKPDKTKLFRHEFQPFCHKVTLPGDLMKRFAYGAMSLRQ